jgi:ABC-type multidrug transport system ATPase subunit
MASALEMESFLDKKVGILSYGQKQRLAIIPGFMSGF